MTLAAEHLSQIPFHLEPCMVAGNRNSH
jgi:hypothetical protein